MKKIIFFTHGWIFYVGAVQILLPYYIAIYLMVFGVWWAIFIGIILSYFFYCSLNRCVRIIIFDNEKLYVPPSYVIFDAFQHSIKTHLKDIVYIDFTACAGNSKGKRLVRTNENPFLVLYLKDDTTQRICLLGFSNKQVKKIQKTLLTLNPEILIYHDCSNITDGPPRRWS